MWFEGNATSIKHYKTISELRTPPIWRLDAQFLICNTGITHKYSANDMSKQTAFGELTPHCLGSVKTLPTDVEEVIPDDHGVFPLSHSLCLFKLPQSYTDHQMLLVIWAICVNMSIFIRYPSILLIGISNTSKMSGILLLTVRFMLILCWDRNSMEFLSQPPGLWKAIFVQSSQKDILGRGPWGPWDPCPSPAVHVDPKELHLRRHCGWHPKIQIGALKCPKQTFQTMFIPGLNSSIIVGHIHSLCCWSFPVHTSCLIFR